MNDLSWMIYLAGVVDNINTALTLVTISSLPAFALGIAVWLSAFGDTDTNRQGLHVMRYSFVTGVAALTLSLPVPSKDVVYAIAASEAGEQALASPLANKATQALNAWLDRQLAEDTKEDK